MIRLCRNKTPPSMAQIILKAIIQVTILFKQQGISQKTSVFTIPSLQGKAALHGGISQCPCKGISFDEVHQLFTKYLDIEPGGHWKPEDPKPRWKVVILIPFHNTMNIFLIFIPMLQKQQQEFAFYVIEQSGTQPFNPVMLFKWASRRP